MDQFDERHNAGADTGHSLACGQRQAACEGR
jgi:hypothetical protein